MDRQTQNHTPNLSFLADASRNSFYADQLADMVETQGLIKAPSNLKASILERSRQMDVQLIAHSNRLSKKLELFTYGLKGSVAVYCCVCFILTTPATKKEMRFLQLFSDYTPLHVEATEKLQIWAERLLEFSDQLWDREGLLHDE